MSDLARAFDYTLVAPESVDRLKEISQEITVIAGNAGVQIGMRLVEAQRLFNKRGKSGAEGGFLDWVEREAGIAQRTAYEMIAIYERQSVNNDLRMCANHFSRSIQARLAAPSTPDSVIEKAREVAESGGTLTVAQVEEMKRQAKAEARAEMDAEKAELQSKLDQTDQSREDWRQQAIAEKKARTEESQKRETAQAEAATLRRTLATEADKLASAKVLELKQKLDLLTIDKQELTDKLKKLRKDQDAAVETRAKQVLQAQQDEINRREAQLRALEGRIEVLNARLIKVDQQDQVVAHFETAIKKLKASMNALSLDLMDAIDPESAPFLPFVFLKDFERIAADLEQGAAGIRHLLDQIEIRQLEVIVHE